MMPWVVSWRADPHARQLADRHYNRQRIGARQFVPPGRCLILTTDDYSALWVTSWPFPEYVKHQWAGAWVCSCFRNESPLRASDLIRHAVAATRHMMGDPPPLGMVTFVDAAKVRRTREPGRTFRLAGSDHVGATAGGLRALLLKPESMPPAEPPRMRQGEMFT